MELKRRPYIVLYGRLKDVLKWTNKGRPYVVFYGRPKDGLKWTSYGRPKLVLDVQTENGRP